MIMIQYCVVENSKSYEGGGRRRVTDLLPPAGTGLKRFANESSAPSVSSRARFAAAPRIETPLVLESRDTGEPGAGAAPRMLIPRPRPMPLPRPRPTPSAAAGGIVKEGLRGSEAATEV